MSNPSAIRRFLPNGIVVSVLLLIAATAGFPSAASAQDSKPSQSSAGQSDTEKSDQTLKVNVNVVGIFFNVKDKHGALIPNQTKDDFEVSEDGKGQTIKYFTAESNLPLTLGIMIDTSGSQVRVLDMEKEVGGAFLRQVLTAKDEA